MEYTGVGVSFFRQGTLSEYHLLGKGAAHESPVLESGNAVLLFLLQIEWLMNVSNGMSPKPGVI